MANAADSQIVEIVPDGDIILVVGPDKAKLRVKSMFLMAASKPFSVMLGPNWKEGHDMRYHDGPFELSLPEDNATAMEIICSVIHLQNDRIPRTLPAGDVLAIAITADKYDCLNALQFASKAWIRKPKVECKDLMLLTAAAYIFGDAEAFNRATTALVLDCHGSYLALYDSEIESIIPWKVFSMLEEQRGLARLKAAEILVRQLNDGGGPCDNGCVVNSVHGYAYMNKLKAENLWPENLQNISIWTALKRAKSMADPVPTGLSIHCNLGRSHSLPKRKMLYLDTLWEFRETVGLCLECVRGGSRSVSCKEPSHSSQG